MLSQIANHISNFDDTELTQIVMLIYLVATFSFMWAYSSKGESNKKIPHLIVWIAFILHTISLLWRWKASYDIGYGHAPLTNRYESLVFFSWTISGMYLFMKHFFSIWKIGAFMMFLAGGFIGFTSLIGADADITPLMPALKSNWLLFHVMTCFLAYSAFAAAFIAGIYSLLKHASRKGPETDVIENLDQIMYRTIMIGFLLLTLGIISGSAWAYNAWGRYWGWDPKEVWSLITWFVYAIFLHARVTKGWQGKKLALISIIGFIFVIFTFLGVNYLPIFKGLHSYA